MPDHARSARHEHEHEHEHRPLHRLLHPGASLLERKRPASWADGIAARAVNQAQARQTEGWP